MRQAVDVALFSHLELPAKTTVEEVDRAIIAREKMAQRLAEEVDTLEKEVS